MELVTSVVLCAAVRLGKCVTSLGPYASQTLAFPVVGYCNILLTWWLVYSHFTARKSKMRSRRKRGELPHRLRLVRIGRAKYLTYFCDRSSDFSDGNDLLLLPSENDPGPPTCDGNTCSSRTELVNGATVSGQAIFIIGDGTACSGETYDSSDRAAIFHIVPPSAGTVTVELCGSCSAPVFVRNLLVIILRAWSILLQS